MIGGLTYVKVMDRNQTQQPPNGDTLISFADYNEAMSYAKWLDVVFYGTDAVWVSVWNWYGNSGYWDNGTFYDASNQNYISEA